MKIVMIRCEECDRLMVESDRYKLDEREYIAIDVSHICKPCAKNTTVYDFIANQRKKKNAS